jgi:hypothetical protein
MPGVLSRGLSTSACLVVLAWSASSLAFSQSNVQAPVLQPQPKHSILDPAINRPPDANQIMLMREQQAKKKHFDAANLERMRQLDEDSTLLLKLAGELKTEIGKTSDDGLSPDLMRKIEDIERLAHNVEQKMKLTMGAS